MSELYIIAADEALRSAIAEQIKPALPGEMNLREESAIPTAIAPGTAALIIDAPAEDKKTAKFFRDMQEAAASPKIFLLTEGPTSCPEEIITESFAKPLRLGHLLARLQFHLQPSRAQTEPLTFGPYRLEPHIRQITIIGSGAVIRLTEKETHLLDYIGRSAQPVTREELLAAIWGYDGRIDTHTLETHIYRLRRKLDPDNNGLNAIMVESGAYRLMAQA